MSFEPRNVCITGGAGFIGANFVRHWLDAHARGPGGGARCADLCREHRESRRPGSRSALCLRARRYLRRGRGARAARAASASIRWCISRPNRMSIARSWVPMISSAPMSSARMRCSRRRRRCGWTARPCPRIAFIMCRPTRCTDRLGPMMRRFTNQPRTRRIRRIPRARPPRIIWCAPITRPMGSIPRSPIAPTTTDRINFRRN